MINMQSNFLMKKCFYYVIESNEKTPEEIRSKLLKNRQKLDLLLQNAPELLKSKSKEENHKEGDHIFTSRLLLNRNTFL